MPDSLDVDPTRSSIKKVERHPINVSANIWQQEAVCD